MGIAETLLDDLGHHDNRHRLLECSTERRLAHRVPVLVARAGALNNRNFFLTVAKATSPD